MSTSTSTARLRAGCLSLILALIAAGGGAGSAAASEVTLDFTLDGGLDATLILQNYVAGSPITASDFVEFDLSGPIISDTLLPSGLLSIDGALGTATGTDTLDVRPTSPLSTGFSDFSLTETAGSYSYSLGIPPVQISCSPPCHLMHMPTEEILEGVTAPRVTSGSLAVPEPGMAALAIIGLVTVAALALRRRRPAERALAGSAVVHG